MARLLDTPWSTGHRHRRVTVQAPRTNVGVQAVVVRRQDGYTLLLVGMASAISASLYEAASPSIFFRIPHRSPVIRRFPLALKRTASVFTRPRFPNSSPLPWRIPARSIWARRALVTRPQLGCPRCSSADRRRHGCMRAWITPKPPAVTDIRVVRCKSAFGNATASIEHIPDRASLSSTPGDTAAAIETVLPDVPTVADTVPGYEASGWFRSTCPRCTSAQLAVSNLTASINAGLTGAGIWACYAELGSAPVVLERPHQFGAHLAARNWTSGSRSFSCRGAKPG